jgi:hypothetical protein
MKKTKLLEYYLDVALMIYCYFTAVLFIPLLFIVNNPASIIVGIMINALISLKGLLFAYRKLNKRGGDHKK